MTFVIRRYLVVGAKSVNSLSKDAGLHCDSIILASSSPRRSELLRELGVPFEVQPSSLDEPTDRPADLLPELWAEALAVFKARSVANVHPGTWVLGADTIVVCAGKVLGKPADRADARRMLELQGGRPSHVITGVALLRVEADGRVRRIVDHDVTQVWMRDDPVEREAYLAGDDWVGKAGAYGIQDVGDRLIERIEGSSSNVVGLPLERVAALLGKRAERSG